jgi:hypothetical protein
MKKMTDKFDDIMYCVCEKSSTSKEVKDKLENIFVTFISEDEYTYYTKSS